MPAGSHEQDSRTLRYLNWFFAIEVATPHIFFVPNSMMLQVTGFLERLLRQTASANHIDEKHKMLRDYPIFQLYTD